MLQIMLIQKSYESTYNISIKDSKGQHVKSTSKHAFQNYSKSWHFIPHINEVNMMSIEQLVSKCEHMKV